MKVTLICIGKTDDSYIQEGCVVYIKRLQHYFKTEVSIIPDLKNVHKMDVQERKKKEGHLILKQIEKSDTVILLDEKGKEFSSRAFAEDIQKKMNSGAKRVVFVIGGAFGFSEELYQRSTGKLSLSKMTFSHQMVRLFFLEQLYRANTILNNEPYHND